jgi:hypothetical protein
MRQLAVGLVCSITLLATGVGAAKAGLFDSLVTTKWETKPADENYKLESYGYDLRVYEFTPMSNPKISCIALYGETGPTGIQCFQKSN